MFSLTVKTVNTQELCKILQSYSLHQHVSVATHTKDHCLDAAISNQIPTSLQMSVSVIQASVIILR